MAQGDGGAEETGVTRPLSREDLRAIVEASEWPCECREGVKLVADEMPGSLCQSCKARRWLAEGVKISEELS